MLDTKATSDKLASEGFKYSIEEIATLARLRAFPNAQKDSKGQWLIPMDDVNTYVRKAKRKQKWRWITLGSVISFFTLFFGIVSSTKDGLDLFKDYILLSPTSHLTSTAESPLSIQQLLLSSSDAYYKLEITVQNFLAQETLIKSINISSMENDASIPCHTGEPGFRFSDKFQVHSSDDSVLSFQGTVVNEDQDGYQYLVTGFTNSNCGQRSLNLNFETSFVLPPNQFSTFYLLFPHQLKIVNDGEQSSESDISNYDYLEASLFTNTDEWITGELTITR